ncbi:hypothetical protein Tco_0171382 [Tanacetum coccineum]
MYLWIFVIPRRTVRILGSLMQKFKTQALRNDFWTNQFRTRSYLCSINNNISKSTERELDLLFEAMYDDYISGQPSDVTRNALAAQAPQFLQTPTTSKTTTNTTLTPTNSSSQAIDIPNTLQDVDKLEPEQQHLQ